MPKLEEELMMEAWHLRRDKRKFSSVLTFPLILEL